MKNLTNNNQELAKHFNLEELEERVEFKAWAATDGGRAEDEIGIGAESGGAGIGIHSGGAGDATATVGVTYTF